MPKSSSRNRSDVHLDATPPTKEPAADAIPATSAIRPWTRPLRRWAIPPMRVEKNTWVMTTAATVLALEPLQA